MELIFLGLIGWVLLSVLVAPAIGKFCNPMKAFKDRTTRRTHNVLQVP